MTFPPHELFASDDEFYASLPLPQRHIRVLRLQALRRGEADTTPLTCKLVTVNLDNKRKAQRFTALSYTWDGAPSPAHTIRCGTRSLNISVNLHAALIAIRRLYGSINLWVDAICIDQKNGVEKQHQIPLMGEIYSLAVTVFVWLGSGTQSSDNAMDWISDASKLALGSFSNGSIRWNDVWDLLIQGFIRIHGKCSGLLTTSYLDYEIIIVLVVETLSSICRVSGLMPVAKDCFTQSKFVLTYTVRDSTFIRRLRKLQPTLPSSLKGLKKYNVDDFEDLLGRGWADRAWTYQELLLAKHPVIICGSKAISWDQLIRGLSFLKELMIVPSNYRKPLFWRFFDTFFGTQRAFLRNIKRIVMNENEYPLPGKIEAWMSLYYHWMHLVRLPSDPEDDSVRVQGIMPGRSLARGLSWSPWSDPNPQPLNRPSRTFGTYRDRNVRLLKILGAINLSVVSLGVFPAGLVMIGLLVFFYNPSAFASIFGKLFVILWISLTLWVYPLIFTTFYPLVTGIGPRTTESGLHNFRGILRALRTRISTDPKDRSYSLYGILEYQGATLATPESSMTTRQVYTDLLLDLLHWNNRSLLLLLDCCYSASSESPTWVPDWLVATKACWLSESYIYGHSIDECAPASLCHYKTRENKANLMIYGINPQNAHVTWILEPLQGNGRLNNLNNRTTETFKTNILLIKQWIYQIQRYARVPSIHTPFFQGVFETVEGKLTEHHVEQPGTQPIEALDNFSVWFSTMTEQEHTENGYSSSIHVSTIDEASELTPPAPAVFGSTESLEKNSVALEYHWKICQQIIGKRLLCLFKTAQGTYMGTGPLSMKVGDILVLISGLPVPLVLRECISATQTDKTTYKVIGPALVPGMMRGEMWPWTNSPQPPRTEELMRFELE